MSAIVERLRAAIEAADAAIESAAPVTRDLRFQHERDAIVAEVAAAIDRLTRENETLEKKLANVRDDLKAAERAATRKRDNKWDGR